MTIEATIDRLGTEGDGMFSHEATLYHVPRTLPGERIAADLPTGKSRRAALVRRITSSPQRITPPCPHFEQLCGGCALQQYDDSAYAAWKRQLVVSALERAGFANPAVGALGRTPARSRRRMDFAAQRREGGLDFGLHRGQDAAVIDLQACDVLHPVLFALIAPLRKTLSSLAALRRLASVIANLTEAGPDLLLRTDGPLTQLDRQKLASLAQAEGLPRMTWALNEGPPETAALSATPTALFGATRVDIPPGAFLQASTQGEAAIVDAVLAALPAKRTQKSFAVELYAGCGTISFPAGRHLRVRAYEGDAAAAAAVRRAQTGTRVEMTHRDLARQPLSVKELSGASAIILDPPFAGATAQMANIAASQVPAVIYVSCNPAALAKDASRLHQAGYRLQSATPIDQFLWSAQVECVAHFVKP